MRRITALISVIVFVLLACVGCSLKGRKEIVFKQDELLDEKVSLSPGAIDILKENGNARTVNFHRGEIKIYGQIYLPEGEGPFPVVVITGGFCSSVFAHQTLAKKLAENGIAGVIYESSCSGSQSKSEGNYLDYSVLTMAADIESVILSLAEQEYIDTSNIFLWGHSIGGLASGYVGFNNPDAIKGMILVEPSFSSYDETKETYPDFDAIPDVLHSPMYIGGEFYRAMLRFDIYEPMPSYNGRVLIYAGKESPSMGTDEPEYLTRADELLPSSELVFVDGANHGFGGSSESTVIAGTIAFVKEK